MTTRQCRAALANDGLQSLGHLRDHFVEIGHGHAPEQLRLVDVRQPVRDIFPQRAGEKNRHLRHHGDAAAVLLHVEIHQIFAIEQNAAARGAQEADNQVHQGRLA
ncbi:MAG: hypothetical protein B9S32_05735 [Verrucomicrobia bacterium Tous-C9LFEB]|nr:MAG: hypothetical protein B9S32_05735 [Verrucomicrobia bacterium Tous-C9LFEB]